MRSGWARETARRNNVEGETRPFDPKAGKGAAPALTHRMQLLRRLFCGPAVSAEEEEASPGGKEAMSDASCAAAATAVAVAGMGRPW